MSSDEKDQDIVPFIEKYVILLLGSMERPVPSPVHLQKEIFILSRAVKKIEDYIVFEKHYFGPYSVDLDNASKDPTYYPSAYNYTRNGYELTDKGHEYFFRIVNANKDNDKFQDFLAIVRMVRELYDVLSQDELLFLVYSTYGEDYTRFSSVSKKLLEPKKAKEIAKGLLSKGMITKSRYEELVRN